MPYVARKRLKVGEGYVEYGEEVPDFETWSKGAQRRLLNSGHVERVPEAPKAQPQPRPKRKAANGSRHGRGGAAPSRSASSTRDA